MSRSIRRFLAVFGLDLRHNVRRPMLYVWLALLALFAWGFAAGAARIQAGDSSVGGQKAFVTSQFAIAQQLAILGLMVHGFFVAVIAGMSPVSDQEIRIGEILNSTSLRPREYVWGKFLAALATFLAVAGAQIGLMILFNHVLPGRSESAELRGPFALSNYLRPALVFLLPLILFLAGTSYALGQRSRSPILVFVMPVALLLFCGFFLWDWSPSWLDPRINRALMLIDPTGFRWLNETWLDVDRGVEFYNSAAVPFDLPFLLSRLAFASVGLASVALAVRHMARMIKGARVSRAVVESIPSPSDSPIPAEVGTSDRSLAALSMSARRPGILSGAWHVARVELRELRSSPGLYIFIPLILLQTIGISITAVGAFDTPLLATSGTLATSAMAPLTIMVCLLLLFYTVESILRERHVRLDSIAYATPVRTSSLLMGKVFAGAFIGVAVLLATLVADLIVLGIQRVVPFEPRPFLLVWGLLLIPTFLVWTAFVAAVLALTRNRYATYAIGLAALAFSGYRFVRGQMNWLGNWPLWRSVQWSDLSILEFDRMALVMNRTWILALAALFTALTGLWFARRDRDAAATINRLRPRSLFWNGLRLSPVLVPALVLGFTLYSQIERGAQGGALEKRQKDYWRQNLATWQDAPLPTIQDVDIDLDLDTERSAFTVKGSYKLTNLTGKPLRDIPVTAGFHWDDIDWTWDDITVEPIDRTRLFIFHPEKPLAPGASARLGFSYTGRFPSGISKSGGGAGEFILPSGVVMTSFGTSFAPVLGYQESIGVDEKNRYESRKFPDDFYKDKIDPAFGSGAQMTTRLRITAPADFTVNSVGTLVSSEENDGRRTVVWKSDEPVHFFNVVAGRWAVKRAGDTAVFYHPAHTYNVEALSEALQAARKYYSEWFYPYPWKELKLSEFPALASYAQGFPTNITFSESIGFLTDASDKADAAFLVAAHESAHQWWGNILLPGKGPGGNVLSEGMAHFSTALLMEQIKGPKGRIEFLKGIERRYAEQRNADEERPLVLIDGSLPTDGTVTYDRGGWAFFMLMEHLGRDRMLRGLRAFIERNRTTDDFPVLQDLIESLRAEAPDPAAYDAFTRQWFFEKALPEFQLESAKKAKDSKASWTAEAKITNRGTGAVRVAVAAERGERFPKDDAKAEQFEQSLVEIDLKPGETKPVSIKSSFEPTRLVVDPDVRILQLERTRAKADL